MEEVRFVPATFDQHGAAVRVIFNEVIATSTANFDYTPRTVEQIQEWFEAKSSKSCPIIAMENLSGDLLGFATYMGYRDKPGYKYSVEHSVYISADHRGKGLGRVLLSHLVDYVKAKGFHMMVGGVVADNAASVALHESLGFKYCGTVKECGYKFGEWQSVSFYQLIFEGPDNPADG